MGSVEMGSVERGWGFVVYWSSSLWSSFTLESFHSGVVLLWSRFTLESFHSGVVLLWSRFTLE